jgi:hypothetical protein
MYDKDGSVLRVEMVINNPEEFKVRKKVMRKHKQGMEWVSMRKGVAYLFCNIGAPRCAANPFKKPQSQARIQSNSINGAYFAPEVYIIPQIRSCGISKSKAESGKGQPIIPILRTADKCHSDVVEYRGGIDVFPWIESRPTSFRNSDTGPYGFK